ncbi:MAG: 2-isopropylmalate synthase [Hyphomonadaceae bacterium]|nr:MAG: 2-isopropylmalate synthase [Hyphomonadaceae bacterium]
MIWAWRSPIRLRQCIEEIVMALKVRENAMPFSTQIDATRLFVASKMVSRITGFPVQYNKAIVGKNAFAHESGIHQDGMLKNAETYEIMTPESVGQGGTNLVMGKHSGRHAFKDKLRALGYELSDNAFMDAFTRFKDLADKKKFIFDDDLVALVDDAASHVDDAIKVSRLRVVAGTDGPQTAEIDLLINGEKRWTTMRGNGRFSAPRRGRLLRHRPRRRRRHTGRQRQSLRRRPQPPYD